MNYKLLFEMECEKHRQTEGRLKVALIENDKFKENISNHTRFIARLNDENKELRVKLGLNLRYRGEVQPKLQQRIIEIYC